MSPTDPTDAALLARLYEALRLANEATARLLERAPELEALGEDVWADLLAVEDNHYRVLTAAGELWRRFGGVKEE
jgi:hypothetical protein